jgi:predicted PurR-regulated permease PerM
MNHASHNSPQSPETLALEKAPENAAAGSEPAPPRRGALQPLTGIRVAITILASIALLWSLQWSADFLIPCTVAVCMTFWLMPLVDRLTSWKIPRWLSSAVVLVALIGGLGFTGYVLRDDAREFAANLPAAAHRARLVMNDAAHDPNGIITHIRGVFSDRTPITGSRAKAVPEPVTNNIDVQEAILRSSSTAVAAAANVVVVIFAIYLMLLSGDLFRRKLITVIGSQSETAVMSRKRVTVDILNEIAIQFQRYLAVLAVTNMVIGLMTWGAFTALGVEHAAVWGVAAAVMHIVPYLGPALIAIASLLVSSVQFDSISQGVVVASTALLIFGLIGMLFQTWLSGRASNMNSVAVFLGLMFWGWIWGVWGLLLGTPLTMALKVVADRVDCLNWLGTFLGEAPRRERKIQSALEPTAVTPLITEGVTESAAMPVLSEPAFIAGEMAAEADVIVREAERIASVADEAVLEKESDPFGAQPHPA